MLHKKQLLNLAQDIYKVNKDVWGNPRFSYDDTQECAYPIEEALEGFPNLDNLASKLMIDSNDPKELSREIIKLASGGSSISNIEADTVSIEDVDRLDKHIDILVYTIGSIYKLGVTVEQLVDSLQIVVDANSQKTGEKDSQNKVIKNSRFVPPEDRLQKILDKRPK